VPLEYRMTTLSFTNAKGATFTFDPVAGQWTAQAEGRKPTSSQSIATLTERVDKWFTPPPLPKKNAAPVVKRTELKPVALVGVEFNTNGVNRNSHLPALTISTLTGKVGWGQNGAELASYQKKDTKTWATSGRPLFAIDPQTFEDSDEAFWVAAAMVNHYEALLQKAEYDLASAWLAHNPVNSHVMRMEGRMDKGVYGKAVPLSLVLAPNVDRHEARYYTVAQPNWPVFPGPLALKLDPKEMDGWTTLANGALQHTSGVEVALTGVSSRPDFTLTRPGDDGERQTLYSGHEFATVLRLGRITAQIMAEDVPAQPMWKGTTGFGGKPNDALSWPRKVNTVALALLFTNEQFRHGEDIEPFVLQTVHKASHETKAAPTYPIWRSAKRDIEVTYQPEHPADALRAHRKPIQAMRKALKASVAALAQEAEAILTRQHRAALTAVYNAEGDGEPETEGTLTRRLAQFFQRAQRLALQTPEVKAAEVLVATLKEDLADTLKQVSPSAKPTATPAPARPRPSPRR
jgi:hypothetical protein